MSGSVQLRVSVCTINILGTDIKPDDEGVHILDLMPR
jgi:hypothetical protein